MQLNHRYIVLLLWLLSFAAWAAGDFAGQLKEAGVAEDKVKLLLDQDITDCEVVNQLENSDLKEIGLTLGLVIKIKKLCAPPPPPEVASLECATDLEQRSVGELLQCLAADLKNEAVLRLLRNQAVIKTAELKTERWAVVDKNKQWSPELTLQYLNFLNKGASSPQTKFKDHRTVPIGVALKLESDEWLHPLFEGRIIVSGLDEFEADWSNVPLEVMNALLWSRLVKHKLFPNPTDGGAVLKLAQAAAVKPLADTVLLRLVEDYKAALEEEDSLAKSVNIKKKP